MVIWTIAKTTVGEAMRKKVLNVCLIVAIAMIVISLSFSQFSFKQDMTLVKGMGLGVIMIAALVISLIMCISLIPNEVERRTIYTILAKPVKRYEFVLGKFIGGLLTLAINVAVMGTVFIVITTIKAYFSTDVVGGTGGAGVAAGEVTRRVQAFDPQLVLGVVMIYFQFLLLSSVVVFLSVFLTPTVNFFAGFGIYIIGSFAAVWQSMYAKGSQANIVVQMFYRVIHTVVPNFDYFNLQNKLIHPVQEVRSLPIFMTEAVVYAVLFSTVVMVAAVLLFERKEV
jgi:ABC-type transport system involved in multi-copper enzyme maturation permease subunit